MNEDRVNELGEIVDEFTNRMERLEQDSPISIVEYYKYAIDKIVEQKEDVEQGIIDELTSKGLFKYLKTRV